MLIIGNLPCKSEVVNIGVKETVGFGKPIRWGGVALYWFKILLSRLESRNVNLLILVTFVSIVVGTIVIGSILALTSDNFGNFWGAAWWVFKAILGPDYLDDQNGPFLSALSLIVVLIGYVAFGSGTIALISTLVAQKVERSRSGTAKIPLKNHIAILNFSDELDETLQELLVVDKSRMVAILTPSRKDRFEEDIFSSLPEAVQRKSLILCREGSPYNQADLDRVNVREASKVIVLSPDAPRGRTGFRRDMSTLKLLMLLQSERLLPKSVPIIAEVNDSRSVKHIESLVKRDNLVLVNGDGVTGSILCQSSLEPHLVKVFGEILSYDGNEFYQIQAGLRPGKYSSTEFLDVFLEKYNDGIPIGVRNGNRVQINPDLWIVDDKPCTKLIVLSKRSRTTSSRLEDRTTHRSLYFPINLPNWEPKPVKILITGQNPRLHYVLAGYRSLVQQGKYDSIEVVLITDGDFDFGKYATKNFTIDQDSYDVLIHSDKFENLIRERNFDSILILSQDGVTPSERDVNVLAEALLVSESLSEEDVSNKPSHSRPRIIAELLDQYNAGILRSYETMDVVVSSQMVGRLIAQCIEDPGIKRVFDELLFHPDNRIVVRPSVDYVPEGTVVRFDELMRQVSSVSHIVLGVVQGGEVSLNPSFDSKYTVSRDLDLVIMLGKG
jgi:hypothetical protein